MHQPRKPLALTMGEPSGIAGEIVVKAWAGDGKPVPPFVYLGDPAWLRAEAHRIRSHYHVVEVSSCDEAVVRFADGIPVLPVALAERPTFGMPHPANAAAVTQSIRHAVDLVISGHASAVVTNPIHKAALYAAGFKFPGHTEFLADLTGGGHAVMMLCIEGLRVVPVTVHQSLASAIKSLTVDSIVSAAVTTNLALRKEFGIAMPRIAVAALNPHAGEDGTMGDEEVRIISPAVTQLRQQGVNVVGPLPADTLFHAGSRKRFDAVICMYHDQALIPLKTLDFQHGVNTTLGLSIVRTSPDHGTAFDIAGSGKADPSSLLAALRLADEMSRNRAAHA
ncbi:MAG: 4-hydroxythreonine-4-phosphate dehydrogenase PdxA [Micropepsaceae bacterium]